MKLYPLHDRVIIEPLAAPQMSDGGLILSVRPQNEANTGRVVAVGRQVPDGLVGLRVIYRPGKYDSVTVQGKKLLVMRYEDLDAIQESAP